MSLSIVGERGLKRIWRMNNMTNKVQLGWRITRQLKEEFLKTCETHDKDPQKVIETIITKWIDSQAKQGNS